MKIAHIALWTRQLEQQARFCAGGAPAEPNAKYCSQTNPGFESFFVRIGDDIAIELMTKPGLTALTADNNHTGWVHLAITVGGAENVDRLAKRAAEQDILVSAPRTTGDGYYEAVIKDPDGNLIEIVA